jgi:PTS system cellobiose-specific IIA component
VEELELISFEIISNVGTARSCYIEAMRLAKSGDFEGAAAKIEAGDSAFNDGHTSHMKLLRVDQKTPMGLLVMHAEDQLMSAETFKIMAMEFIDMYKKVTVLEERIGKL